ncbi:hypothetical protein BD289DRAFT_227305 [Coniella lustricola]|uniref:Uncharacterized protein n=1 Tax=Coniella lustricola TaxID=2025994 RepID=A0A2T3AAN9_9PEZI|nr:hypothetical protein BD289DRAFT_227305 [Coniella lustricola]
MRILDPPRLRLHLSDWDHPAVGILVAIPPTTSPSFVFQVHAGCGPENATAMGSLVMLRS